MHHQHPHRLNVWPFNANANLNQPGANQSMMAAAAAQLHQTQFQLLLQQQLQHQQQELYASYMNSTNQKQPQQQQSQPGKFNSPFSVNNLLERAPLQQTTFQQQQQQQNQQILGQYLASAIESYRYQKSAFNQNPASSGSPKKLKPEFNDQGVATQPNESVCSISSSPSSSSTTSATSLSFDYSHNSTQHHMIDSAALNGNHATGNSERNSPDLLSTSSSVASSSSSSSSSCSSSSASFSCLNNSTNHSKRKRQLSIDLNNLNCPICGLQLNGYSDLKSHLEYELIKLNDESSFVSLIKKNNSANQNEEAYLQKNPRYLKYLEIKENRRKREITKSKQRSTTASKELDCHRRKRSYEDEDNLLTNTGSETNSKRLKPTTINNGNIYEDNDEEQINNNTEDPYINVVDEDVDEDVVDDEVAAETLSQHNDSMDEFNDNRQHQHSTSIHDSTNFSEESENLNQSNDSKCQLCSESFKNVYVSVKCWHAFCRKCWGKSINTTKRCPQSQCNLETSVKELRKVNV